jgi:nickel superoxide dismutase
MKSALSNYIPAMLIAGFLFLVFSSTAYSHCQIPCGIYDDYLRLEQMIEDSDTIIKSTRSLAELSGKTDIQSDNQRVRWVMNKENHAQKIIQTISDYFLTQRVKPEQKDYVQRLKNHHAVIIAAMKAKQSASEETAAALKKAVETLAVYYPVHTH